MQNKKLNGMLLVPMIIWLQLTAAADKGAVTITYRDQGFTHFELVVPAENSTCIASLYPLLAYPLEGGMGVLMELEQGDVKAARTVSDQIIHTFHNRLKERSPDYCEIEKNKQQLLSDVLNLVNRNFKDIRAARIALAGYYTLAGVQAPTTFLESLECSSDCSTVVPSYDASIITRERWDDKAVLKLNPCEDYTGYIRVYTR